MLASPLCPLSSPPNHHKQPNSPTPTHLDSTQPYPATMLAQLFACKPLFFAVAAIAAIVLWLPITVNATVIGDCWYEAGHTRVSMTAPTSHVHH